MGKKSRGGSVDRGGRGSERPEQIGKDSARSSDGRRVFGSGEGLERTRSEVIEPVLTPAARRHIGQLRRAIRAGADRVDRLVTAPTLGRGHESPRRNAFPAMPTDAASAAVPVSYVLRSV